MGRIYSNNELGAIERFEENGWHRVSPPSFRVEIEIDLQKVLGHVDGAIPM